MSIRICLIALVFTAQVVLSGSSSLATTSGGSDAAPVSKEQIDQLMIVLKQRLDLRDDQTETIRSMMPDHLKNLRGILVKYSSGSAVAMPALMAEFNGARDEFRDQVAPLLNEKQMKEFMALRKEVDESIRSTICDEKVAFLKTRLNLTDDQVVAIRPIILDDYERKRELISFQMDAAGGPRTRRALWPEVQKVQEETEKRLAGVFTPDQMKEYSAYLDEMRRSTSGSEAGKG
ncbi:MAG: hypothetical protein O7A63_03175 [Acidobacteria bacterium]|nr:hypothetical protein [Acidobacteriota bacterium]